MTISEEIIREIYRLVREEGYHPNLSGIERIQFSCGGFDELCGAKDIFSFVTFDAIHGVEKFYGIPIKINRRQEAKFRVICKPTDD